MSCSISSDRDVARQPLQQRAHQSPAPPPTARPAARPAAARAAPAPAPSPARAAAARHTTSPPPAARPTAPSPTRPSAASAASCSAAARAQPAPRPPADRRAAEQRQHHVVPQRLPREQRQDLIGPAQPGPRPPPRRHARPAPARTAGCCPRSARRSPVIRLNSVVLPAPLGPISSRRSPGSIASETSRVAAMPPNRFEPGRRPQRRRRHVTGAARPRAAAEQPLQPRHDPLRHEQHRP